MAADQLGLDRAEGAIVAAVQLGSSADHSLGWNEVT